MEPKPWRPLALLSGPTVVPRDPISRKFRQGRHKVPSPIVRPITEADQAPSARHRAVALSAFAVLQIIRNLQNTDKISCVAMPISHDPSMWGRQPYRGWRALSALFPWPSQELEMTKHLQGVPHRIRRDTHHSMAEGLSGVRPEESKWHPTKNLAGRINLVRQYAVKSCHTILKESLSNLSHRAMNRLPPSRLRALAMKCVTALGAVNGWSLGVGGRTPISRHGRMAARS